MSGARKLQTEIERTLKKVEEGVEIFDEIWDKVYAASQQSQKEKYEVDLKKEIKKLQRLRDQIKTWISSSEVKDKNDLMDARKLIETKMEMFKVCEKETKTKAYSKEGLARAAEMSPEEQAKADAQEVLQGYIEQLGVQMEAAEADMDKLTSGKRSKKNDADASRKQQAISRHQWHVAKMEQMIRMMDNDAMDPCCVEEVKEDIEFYIEANEGMEGGDDMDPYEHLDMDELPAEGAADADDTESSAPSSSAAAEKPKSAKKLSKAEKAAAEKEAQKAAKAAKSAPAPSLLTIGRATAKKPEDDKKAAAAEAAAAPSAPAAAAPAAAAAGIGKGAASMSAQQKAPLSGQSGKASLPLSAASAPPGMASLASILKGSEQPATAQQQQQQQQKQAEQQRQQQAAVAAQKQQQQLLQQQQRQQAAASTKGGGASSSANSMAGLMASLGAAPATASSVAQALAGDANTMTLPLPLSSATGAVPPSAGNVGGGGVLNLVGSSSGGGGKPRDSAQKGSHQGDDNAGDGPFGSLRGSVSGPGGVGGGSADDGSASTAGGTGAPGFVRQDAAGLVSSLAALAQSLQCVPAARDRATAYAPRNPHPTPAAFFCAPGPGGGPSPVFDDPAVFEKFHTDTLFFIFYYQPGTYQQYLAARELKKQSWRFHKKYKTWFQRHEEPTVTTDEYEQGTYVYFDYQGTYESKSGWCQRIKYDFTFEYEFLEDEL